MIRRLSNPHFSIAERVIVIVGAASAIGLFIERLVSGGGL